MAHSVVVVVIEHCSFRFFCPL